MKLLPVKRNNLFLPAFIISLITFLCYLPSIRYDFVFDDLASITQHFNIRHNTFFKLFFSGTRWITYWLNAIYYSIARFNPLPYRMGNILIHITTGCIILFVTEKLLATSKKGSFFFESRFFIAILTALLFLLHPVQTQTVSYVIQGQLEGTALLCTMAIILCFIFYKKELALIQRIQKFFFMFIVAILACGTKEITIIIPTLLVLVDWFFFAKGKFKELMKDKLAHGAIALCIGSIYLYFLKPTFFLKVLGLQMKAPNNLGNIITRHASEQITAYHYLISQFKVIIHYIKIFFWPFNMSVEYDWKLTNSFFSLECLIPLFLLFGIWYGIYRIIKVDKTNPLAFALCWFFIAILPRASIVPSSELIVDYKTYSASFGIFLIIASALVYFFIALKEKISATLQLPYGLYHAFFLTLLVIPLGISTIERNKVWRSSVDFWENMIQNAPNKARVQNNYGVELSLKLGKYNEAIPYFEKAIEMDPFYRDAYNNLAVAYGFTQQIDLAIETLYKTIDLNQYYPEAYNNLASFLIERKRFDEALNMLERAIALNPTYGKAHYNKGRAYFDQENFEESYIHFKNACLNADLDNEIGFAGFAKASMALHRFEDAIFACKKIIALQPTNNQAYFMLGNAYYMSKRYDAAIAVYTQLIERNPNDNRVWFNLGESYLQLNQPQEALASFDEVTFTMQLMPQLYLKKITCYKKLGQNEKAAQLTEELCSNKIIPDDLRLEAKMINQQITS